MSKFAIVKSGGKQYWAEGEATLALEKQEAEVGQEIDLDLISIGSDDDLKFGDALKQKSIKAVVLKHIRDDKVIVFKKKRREHYRRKAGHRQHLTLVKIGKIEG